MPEAYKAGLQGPTPRREDRAAALDRARERMAEFLRQHGVDAVCAWPDGARARREGAAAAVSLRACQGGPGGFRDYLGERYNEEAGRWEELYGRKIQLRFGLDLYAPKGCGAEGIRAVFDRMVQAFHQAGPAGLKIREISCTEVEYDQGMGLFHCPAQAICDGYLYAVADEGGAFLDFIVKGEGRI